MKAALLPEWPAEHRGTILQEHIGPGGGGQEGENKHTQSADTTVWLTPLRPAPGTQAQEENQLGMISFLSSTCVRDLN